MKGKRKMGWLIGVCAAAVVIFAAGLLVGNFLYNFALQPRRGDAESPTVAATQQSGNDSLPEDMGHMFEADEEWADSVGREGASIQSRDGLTLKAGFIPAPEGRNRYVVICHGYHSESKTMTAFAKKFYELGYGALLPDARGHGESEGDYVGMGWDERLDIVDWTHWIASRAPDCEIVLFGVSMGGATVMMASGEELPANVRATVEDCGYSSVREEFSYQLKQLFKLPEFPVLNFASLVTRLRAGYSIMRDGSAAAQVAKSRVPILFIHGGNDTFVPSAMVYTVYEAATCDKQLLVVEDAGHGLASGKDPALYWATVEEFLTGVLGK